MPRRMTLKRMAELSGKPASTFEEHLRKAEIKIFRAIKPYARMSASRRKRGENDEYGKACFRRREHGEIDVHHIYCNYYYNHGEDLCKPPLGNR
ncbi:MAG: helix-turn-helix domain-containing protein [Candidatus Thermoplasmatota archaeon]|nr:helix-turn-helix domain-containing protein [Candidatus Thermoplasmatota archaeon]